MAVFELQSRTPVEGSLHMYQEAHFPGQISDWHEQEVQKEKTRSLECLTQLQYTRGTICPWHQHPDLTLWAAALTQR